MISYLRFENVLNNGGSNGDVSLPGFIRAVLKYMFRLPDDEVGTIEEIFFSMIVETKKRTLDRTAFIRTVKDGEVLFCYVFAEAKSSAPDEWKIVGRSIFVDMHGLHGGPNYGTEMIWVE